jgi:hypothetical protein
MSRAYTTEGHLNDRTSGSHDYPVNSGWRLKVRNDEVYAACQPGEQAHEDDGGQTECLSVHRRPSVHRRHERDHRRHNDDYQDLEDRERRIADRLLRRLERQ